jgi:hypothetical protein
MKRNVISLMPKLISTEYAWRKVSFQNMQELIPILLPATKYTHNKLHNLE